MNKLKKENVPFPIRYQSNREAGFTLIELAVVIVIIGLLATMGLSALNVQLASAAISSTKKKQDTIKDALIAYLSKNKRLPCPAVDNTGQESRVITNAPANCTGYLGIIPYASLGLPKSAALDGWENFFSYAVSQNWTLTYGNAPAAGQTFTNVQTASFSAGSVGVGLINDRLPNGTAIPITNTAVAIIISHGRNGLGAFTSKGTQISPIAGTDEAANAPTATWTMPTSFYQREFTDVDVPTYGAFDDVMQWFSANDLITPLIKDGALKSAEAQWADQVSQINDALASYMFTSNPTCAPPTNGYFNTLLVANNIPLKDPWAGNLNYSQNITKMDHQGNVTPLVPYPYVISTTTPSQTALVPTNVRLYAKYFNAVQNNCP